MTVDDTAAGEKRTARGGRSGRQRRWPAADTTLCWRCRGEMGGGGKLDGGKRGFIRRAMTTMLEILMLNHDRTPSDSALPGMADREPCNKRQLRLKPQNRQKTDIVSVVVLAVAAAYVCTLAIGVHVAAWPGLPMRSRSRRRRRKKRRRRRKGGLRRAMAAL